MEDSTDEEQNPFHTYHQAYYNQYQHEGEELGFNSCPLSPLLVSDDCNIQSYTETAVTTVSETADDRRERKRQKVMQEILDSEDSYQHHLNLIIKHFEEPLREAQVVPDHVLATIFSNIRQIVNINTELREHLCNMEVGAAFLRMGPFLKLYSTYANNHERALATLMNWDQKSVEFTTLRRSQEDAPALDGLKLNALLITPVQRIPRYKLLLEELLAATKEDHHDYNNIKEAVSQISKVALHINEHIKQQDNFQKMLAIHRSLVGQGAPSIMAPGRVFIKEGTLKKVSKKGGRSQERMFFLFSDMLMYAKPKLLESSMHRGYTCCCIMPLQHCTVHRVFGSTQGAGALFTITCKDESLLLYSDQESAQSWISALTSAISVYQENRQSLRKPSSAKQPMRKAALVKFWKERKKMDALSSPARQTRSKTAQPKEATVPCSPQSPGQRLKRALVDRDVNCLSPRKTAKVHVHRQLGTLEEEPREQHNASVAMTTSMFEAASSTRIEQLDESVVWKLADSCTKRPPSSAESEDSHEQETRRRTPLKRPRMSSTLDAMAKATTLCDGTTLQGTSSVYATVCCLQ